MGGGGRDGASRPFGYHAIMIMHARVHGRFTAVGPARQRLMALPALMGATLGVPGSVAPLGL
jgi:hypothetical protein